MSLKRQRMPMVRTTREKQRLLRWQALPFGGPPSPSTPAPHGRLKQPQCRALWMIGSGLFQ
eukprot:9188170-Alexandrium_andersonii.AAC.1